MRVLSLFDGMSCGQLALQKLGITPEKYYASEIDKNPILVTQKNFPKPVHTKSLTPIGVPLLISFVAIFVTCA